MKTETEFNGDNLGVSIIALERIITARVGIHGDSEFDKTWTFKVEQMSKDQVVIDLREILSEETKDLKQKTLRIILTVS